MFFLNSSITVPFSGAAAILSTNTPYFVAASINGATATLSTTSRTAGTSNGTCRVWNNNTQALKMAVLLQRCLQLLE
jgi:hypothetical protein